MHTEGLATFFLPTDYVTPRVVELVQHPRFLSTTMQRNWVVDIYLPICYRSSPEKTYPWLLLNDGQDMKAVHLRETLQDLQERELMEPIIGIAVHAPADRRHVYGVAAELDFKQRGALAAKYAQFIIHELLPYVLNNYRARAEAGTVAGFSLGGLQAFDMAWNHGQYFKQVGVFSGSFWWRRKGYDEGYEDHDRIMLDQVHKSSHKPDQKYWLQTGTHDETADRDQDGIIDAVGDTRDLVRLLLNKGYDLWNDLRYVEVPGGHHNQETWGQVMPDFLQWAFGNKARYTWAPSDTGY